MSPTLLSDLFTNRSYENILHCSLGGYRGEGHGSEGGGDSKEGEWVTLCPPPCCLWIGLALLDP